MRPRLSAPVLTLLLAAALSACSDDPVPIIEPAPSASPSSSVAATPTPTPADDPVPTRESAEDFIRRWQAEAFAMQRTGDVSVYKSLSPKCESCSNLVQSVAEIYAGGGSINLEGEPRIRGLERVGKVDGTLIFEYTLHSPTSQVTDSDGKVQRQFPGGSAAYQVNVSRGAGDWEVSSAVRLAQ